VDDYTATAVISGALIVGASLLSFWEKTRHARLVTLLASLWLMGHGYFSSVRPGPPAAQHEITIGMILLLFAVLPNEINEMPAPWRQKRPQ
jgi:hypothetical protein